MGKTRALVIGGIISGILSVIPLVNSCNCCCCMWVILGGVVAAYILAQADPSATGGDGAIVGAGTGLIAGLMSAIVLSIQFMLFGADQFSDSFMQGFEQAANNPGMTPEGRQAIQELSQAMREMFETTGPILPIIASLLTIPIYAGMGAIGGLIGMSIFNKPTTPTYFPPPPGGGYGPSFGPGYGPQGYPPQSYPGYPPPPMMPPGQSQFMPQPPPYASGAYPPPPPVNPYPAPQPPPPSFSGSAPAPAEPPRYWGPPKTGGPEGSGSSGTEPSGSDSGSGTNNNGNDIFGGSGSGSGDPFAPPGSGK